MKFVIHRSFDDTGLARLARALKASPEVADVTEDEGRWYAVPDRDDLPEWFALHVEAADKAADPDRFEAFLRRVIGETLPPELVRDFTVQRA